MNNKYAGFTVHRKDTVLYVLLSYFNSQIRSHVSGLEARSGNEGIPLFYKPRAFNCSFTVSVRVLIPKLLFHFMVP